MIDENKSFLSNQTIKDSSGTDLNFFNKIIFYTDEFKFLTRKLFENGDWKIQLFEYDYNESEMISNVQISIPVFNAQIHPSITVPTVTIEDSQYSMFTYYIAKTEKQAFPKTNYYWYSCIEINELIKQGVFTSTSIHNLRRFFELLNVHEKLTN